MRALITGGAGFIGSHLSEAVLARGDDVTVVDDLSTGHADQVPAGATLHRVSILDREALTEIVRQTRPDRVFHLAARIDVRSSVTDPGGDADANIVGTINVLEAARATGAPVVFASSGGALYGTPTAIPTPETAAPHPASPYGVAKLCAERYLRLYNRLHSARHSIIRLANVYGPRQQSGVVPAFCRAALTGEDPVVFGDGRQTRDFVYVTDAVSAFLAAGRATRPGIWNIGGGTETSMLDLLRVVADVAQAPMRAGFRPARRGELLRSALATEQAGRDLGWHPSTTLHEGTGAVLSWIRSRQVAPV